MFITNGGSLYENFVTFFFAGEASLVSISEPGDPMVLVGEVGDSCSSFASMDSFYFGYIMLE